MSRLPLPEAYHRFLAGAESGDVNRSLFFERGFDGYFRPAQGPEQGRWTVPAKAKGQFLAAFCHDFQAGSAFDYFDAWQQRRKQALLASGAKSYRFQTAVRLVVGLGLPSPFETGFLFDRLTGCPYLPGSSMKGLLRATAVLVAKGELAGEEDQAFWTQETTARIFGPAGAADGQPARGQLVCFDAFPLAPPRLEVDVLTPHYQDYYAGKLNALPADWCEPVPVAFLTVAAGTPFELFLAGRVRQPAVREADLAAAEKLLGLALGVLGAGGKKSAGYGWFEESAQGPEERISDAAAPSPREPHPREPRPKGADPRPGGDPPPRSGRLGAMAAAFEKARGQETGDDSPKKRSR